MESQISGSRVASERVTEDVTFQGSEHVSLGVELELQILDRETGDLAPGAMRLLGACADEKIEGVSPEFLLSMIEVKTGVCQNVSEVKGQLFPLLRRVRNLSTSLGYEIALGATHPFSRVSMGAFFTDERYQRIQEQQGWQAYNEAVFGLHVHVGVPGGEQAIGAMNRIVQYLPHLLALSANSPFWQGVDTGFASARMRLFKPSAQAGLPPHFTGWNDFQRYCLVMQQAGAIEGTKDIYWDMRPRPATGTIEFRIFDAPATLSTLLGLAALSRALVVEALQLLADQPEMGRGDPGQFWLAAENRWRASLHGLRASCTRIPGEPCLPMAEDTALLLERLDPIARELGDAPFLRALETTSECGADRQRRIYRQTGDWQAVLGDMKSRWVHELEDDPLEQQSPLPSAVAGSAGGSERKGGLASESGLVNRYPADSQSINRTAMGADGVGDFSSKSVLPIRPAPERFDLARRSFTS